MGGRIRVDLRVFVDCTPLYEDIEWEQKLVSIRRAFGLEPPSPSRGPPILLPYWPINSPAPAAPAPAGGSVMSAEQEIRAVHDEAQEKPVSGDQGSCSGVKAVNISSSPARDPDDEVVKKRKLPLSVSSDTSDAPVSAAAAEAVQPKSGTKAVKVSSGAIETLGKRKKLAWVAKIRAEPDKKGRGRPRSYADDLPPSWLEAGWQVKKKIRQNGLSAGHVDKYYESPEGRKFRSRKEAEIYLNKGKAKVF